MIQSAPSPAVPASPAMKTRNVTLTRAAVGTPDGRDDESVDAREAVAVDPDALEALVANRFGEDN